MARGAPAGDAGGRRGRGAGRSLGERRIHLRQEAPARNRPARALPAQAARGHAWSSTSRRRDPTRVFFGAWVRARGARTARAALASHRRPGRVRHGPGLHQHGFAARAQRCSASASTTRSALDAARRQRTLSAIVAIRYGAGRPALQITRTFLNCQGSRGVEVLREQPLALVQRRPVGVLADHRARGRACRSRGCAGSPSRPARRCRGSDSPSPRPSRQAPPTVTCRLVALLYGASLRASSIDSCEPYQ